MRFDIAAARPYNRGMRNAFAAAGLVFLLLPALAGVMDREDGAAETPRLGRSALQDIVRDLTLEEKAGLVVGASRTIPSWAPPWAGPADGGGLDAVEPSGLAAVAAGTSGAVPRLGIFAQYFLDGPAGLRLKPPAGAGRHPCACTAFPVATLLASSWDEELLDRVGRAIGDELLACGGDLLLAPALNLQRDPLGGRNFEYFSEDPLLSGRLAAAMVRGIQGRGAGAALKHFAANNAETNRFTLDAVVSQRALRELYLEGFRIAVETARPRAVMSSLNKVNGVYASQSRDLLHGVLRGDWGFDGFVMSDWFAGGDPAAQLAAGTDLLMPGSAKQAAALVEAVRAGRLDGSRLDESVARVLADRLRSGRFQNRRPPASAPERGEHAALARAAAGSGMVLLKNAGGTLPLAGRARRIAVFGNASYAPISGGMGSGDVREAYCVSLPDGLRGAGYAPEAELERMYESYTRTERGKLLARGIQRPLDAFAEMRVPAALAARMAAQADCAIVAIGRVSGEGADRSRGPGDFRLCAVEMDLLRSVAGAFHAAGKRCVVVLNVGGVIETASWRDMPDAILLAWMAGQEAGNGVADVLSGRTNPSGRLAATFPMRYDDAPTAGSFPGAPLPTGEAPAAGDARFPPAEALYREGIYVGYRYYDSFRVRPAYEFGYGLSYTAFRYGRLTASAGTFAGRLVLSLDIANAGAVPGREVAQLYIQAPGRRMEKPLQELRGFCKTRLLAPGEKQRTRFMVDARSLASFDPASSSWIVEAGRYVARVGASSRDIRAETSFRVERDIVVKRESRTLAPPRSVPELRRGP